MSTRSHLWVHGAGASARRALVTRMGVRPSHVVDGHRNHRGPYTAGGTLVRAIAAQALRSVPDVVSHYDSEILSVAPELASVIEGTHETLTSSASPSERTRFYPRARTERVAHALTELVRDVSGDGRISVLFDNVDCLDATDVELLSVMLRRLDPDVVTLVLSSSSDQLDETLAAAVNRHATSVRSAHPSGGELQVAPGDHARAYVDGDCTSDDPRLRGAYEALAREEREVLHDARVARLEAMDEPSLRLGAIPFHLERGSDSPAAADALMSALEHCTLMGFYDAVLDLGARLEPMLDWLTDADRCWLVTAKLTTALTVLDRPDEAADLYDEACAGSTLPSVHLQAAYGRAMLYTRFYDEARRDHGKAKAWINTAIAISSMLPDAQRRAFNITFNENGLALIEMHLGDPAAALRLVTAGLDRLDGEIGPDEQTLHRSVLLYNRAQLLARMGRPQDAIAEYGRLLAADPNHSEYYFERASLHRKRGDVDAAFTDYASAIATSAPYAEPFYNRGDLSFELGDLESAIADFDRVIELDPGFVDAYVNRASARYALDDVEGARDDVAAGLAIDPAQPHLLCLAGLIAQADGDAAGARAMLDAALQADDGLADAWSARAVLSYESGDLEAAIADLDRAIALSPDDAELRANRAVALEEALARCGGTHARSA